MHHHLRLYLLALLCSLCGLTACDGGAYGITIPNARPRDRVTPASPGQQWGCCGGDPQSTQMPRLSPALDQADYQAQQNAQRDGGTDAAAPEVGVVTDQRRLGTRYSVTVPAIPAPQPHPSPDESRTGPPLHAAP